MTDPIDQVVQAALRSAQPTEADRHMIGRHKLAELRSQIEQARTAEGAVAGQEKALDEAVAARERALDQAQAAVDAAEQALLTARANELLGIYTEEPAKRAREAALQRAALAVEEAKEAAAAAERLRAAETPILE